MLLFRDCIFCSDQLPVELGASGGLGADQAEPGTIHRGQQACGKYSWVRGLGGCEIQPGDAEPASYERAFYGGNLWVCC